LENIFPEDKIFSTIKAHAANSLLVTCRPMVIQMSVEIITLLQQNSHQFSEFREHNLANNFYNQTKYHLAPKRKKNDQHNQIQLILKGNRKFISLNLGIFSNTTYIKKKILAWNRIG